MLRDLRFDVLDVAVVLCGFALGRFARHGGRVRRDNDHRFRVALGGASVNTVLVVRTIAGERRHRACDLIEQGTGLRAVVHVLGGQRRGHDLPGAGVHAQAECPPRLARHCRVGRWIVDRPAVVTGCALMAAVGRIIRAAGRAG